MRSRTGKDRRAEGWRELDDSEIKQVRAFDWTKLLLPHAPLLLKIIPLLTIGGVAATQAPKVYDWVNEDNVVGTTGDINAPTTEDIDTQQTRAINEIIDKLKKQDAAIADARKHGRGDDAAQNNRLDALEDLVQ